MSWKYRRCCGIDVHKDQVTVCVLPPDGQQGEVVVKVYRTFTENLRQLRFWLQALKVTEVAMESTGVYWRPVWNVLEGHFRLLLVNPAQVKALLGRKSDRRDARRIAEFLRDQRLDASFVPPPEIRYLRELLRDRVSLVEERTRVGNQIRALLETANIKLGSVASDVLGQTGRRILTALSEGQWDAERLSWKAVGKLRKKEGELKKALTGHFTKEHEFRLRQLLKRLKFLEKHLEELDTEIRRCMGPYEKQVELLMTIPGVDQVVAWTLVAELGVDMAVFPDAAHCASWAGMCPGEKESAGKKQSVRLKKGNRYLRRVLVQAGWAASRKKGSYLQGQFRRWMARRGPQKAVVGVGHQILTVAYAILRDGVAYRELGANYYDRRHGEKTKLRLMQRLMELGYRVEVTAVEGVEPAAEAAMPVVDGAVVEAARKRGRPRKEIS